MKIGEIANAAGVTTSRIRFYEKRGIIAPALRGPNGYRDYPAELVALLRFIEQAQGLGFTLSEIASVEIRNDPQPISGEQAIHMLMAKRDAVDALIEEATQRRHMIDALIEDLRTSGGDRADGAGGARGPRT
ncbi:MerR family transcriptional regulator [Paracoccus sp. CPCC 101403]|uniref:MerR family transcriptional regulator n=1 Tax=Paracoccus broussonetiae TaxID=3075834 RepID=A0ABU3EDR5_9RHOB|nr:MerR family transcriptional regulator [Paracoccus sp. CPCC 101403]MDT1062379.1 MerR family transcriptional regulator [Paracoccus sp. CPCC 101403]